MICSSLYPGDRFARQNRYEPPPEFPLDWPYSSIAHQFFVFFVSFRNIIKLGSRTLSSASEQKDLGKSILIDKLSFK